MPLGDRLDGVLEPSQRVDCARPERQPLARTPEALRDREPRETSNAAFDLEDLIAGARPKGDRLRNQVGGERVQGNQRLVDSLRFVNRTDVNHVIRPRRIGAEDQKYRPRGLDPYQTEP